MLRLTALLGFGKVGGGPVVTWNPVDLSGMTLSEVNQLATETGSVNSGARATTSKSTGKWYVEIEVAEIATTGDWLGGLANGSVALNNVFTDVGFRLLWRGSNALYSDGTNLGSPGALALNDVVCVAYDADTRKAWVRQNNGTWFGGGDPSSGTSPSATLGGADAMYPTAKSDNNAGNTGYRLRAHQSRFLYSAPSGFSPWDS